MEPYEFAKELFLGCDFDELTEDNFENQAIDHINDEYYDAIDYAYGVTKFAIIPNNEDYVLKVPFDGTGEPGWDFDPFLGADDGESGCDYCLAEIEIHNRIEDFKNTNLNEIFARTSYIGDVNYHSIYVQEKCVGFESENYRGKYSEESIETTRSKCDDLNEDCFNAAWLYDVISFYGEETMKALLKCIRDLGISDLHNGNIGYSAKTGAPRIFDYAGYNA